MCLLSGSELVYRAGEQAFATLRERMLPPTPEHYLLWYTHYAGENPALSRMIRLLEQNRDPFGPERCRELYQRYILCDEERQMFAESSERICAIAARLGHIVEAMGTESERASARFDAIGATLGQTTDRRELEQLVAALTAEARHLSARARSLSHDLQKSSREVAELRNRLELARREAETDALTGVANRKGFERALRNSAAQCVDSGRPLAMIVVDIDHFKRFNDSYGHTVGDAVLRLVAGQLREGVREGDLVARYGGEEFVILLPGLDLCAAAEVAERLRARVASRRLRSREDGHDLGSVTLSAGVGVYQPGEPLAAFFQRVDQALYVAKRAGRNRVVREDQVAALAGALAVEPLSIAAA